MNPYFNIDDGLAKALFEDTICVIYKSYPIGSTELLRVATFY